MSRGVAIAPWSLASLARIANLLLLAAVIAALTGLLQLLGAEHLDAPTTLLLCVLPAIALLIWLLRLPARVNALLALVYSSIAGYHCVSLLPREALPNGYWPLVICGWLMAWLAVENLSQIDTGNPILQRGLRLLIPCLFGVWLLIIWEIVTRGLDIPQVLLPSPSLIWDKITSSLPILWADFHQTFVKAVLTGYVMGCGAGFLAALAIDRSPFLQRGLLPIGNLVSALPIVGIAPIMVMWFGFDWQSKAAIVVVMTFFPMLVNTISGLSAASRMQHDLMTSYAASWSQSLFKLRLPQAMPHIFNALKINSTLALIGAIVAEFFGTPIVGMGFRISTEVGRMNVDMVWAEIAVAALAGSLFYGLIVLLERRVTFWHPSIRH